VGIYWTGQYEEAVEALQRALNRNPDFLPARVYLAATYGELGDHDRAKAEVEAILRDNPQTSEAAFREKLPYKDPKMRDRLFGVLRKAGMPEKPP
jgi:tetratricopeptide (TPR) repeat protein